MKKLTQYGGAEVWYARVCKPYELQLPFRGRPFAAMLVVYDRDVHSDDRLRFTDALVEQGCRYAVCAGHDCEAWHDSVDESDAARFPGREIPDEEFVTTTWHDAEPLQEAVFFLLDCTAIGDRSPSLFVVLSIGGDEESDSHVQRVLLSVGHT